MNWNSSLQVHSLTWFPLQLPISTKTRSSTMSENRTSPFCCQHILPQTPFYKHENYPRAYTCVLDFLQLATRFPNYLPQTSLSKTLQQHDFVIRLCKGQADPRFGPNQLGPARYFLHDPRYTRLYSRSVWLSEWTPKFELRDTGIFIARKRRKLWRLSVLGRCMDDNSMSSA